jgi:anti-sigma factor RsiW
MLSMKQTFTPNDLIRFIYRELSPEEEGRIKNLIAENPEMAKELHQLMESVMQLDSVSMDPSESSVAIVLDYSREREKLHC